MSALATFVQHCTGSYSQGYWGKKENRRNPNLKKEVKIYLFADDIFYV